MSTDFPNPPVSRATLQAWADDLKEALQRWPEAGGRERVSAVIGHLEYRASGSPEGGAK